MHVAGQQNSDRSHFVRCIGWGCADDRIRQEGRLLTDASADRGAALYRVLTHTLRSCRYFQRY